MKRITGVSRSCLRVFGEIGASEQPDRRADADASTVMMSEPTMALSKRLRRAGRGVFCVEVSERFILGHVS